MHTDQIAIMQCCYLLGPPASAVDGLVGDVFDVEAVHYFGAVFVDGLVDSGLGVALVAKVARQQVRAHSRSHCNRNDGDQLICTSGGPCV